MLNKIRITDLTEAEELEAGYYVLVDSPTLGTRKIAAENFVPPEPDYLYKWDFTKSLVDEVEGKEVTLGGGAVRTNNGVEFTGRGHRINVELPQDNYTFFQNKTIELDIAKFDFKGSNSSDINFFVTPTGGNTSYCTLCYLAGKGWGVYFGSTNYLFSTELDRNAFNNKKVKIITEEQTNGRKYKLYLNDLFIGETSPNVNSYKGYAINEFSIGSRNSSSASAGDQSYDVTISGLRIYANEEG